ncbi:MAG: tetratricopeptide repeat protein, partial [Vicinamibacterales bacterium]
AWYAIANQDYDQAIAQCRAILERYPDDTEVAGRLSTLLMGESRLDEARDVALRAYNADPRNPSIINTLGGTYSLLGRHADAISMLHQYVALSPGDANAHDSLGLAYQWAGRYQDAVAAYTKAIELNPDFEVPIIHLGNVYYQLGRYRDAIRQYERFIALGDFDQEIARGYGSIAMVHLARGNHALAQAAARRSEAADDTHVLSFLIAAERGDRAAATALWRSAERRDAGRGAGTSRRWAEYLRGRYAQLTGRTDEALAHYRATLRQSPLTYSMESLEEVLGQGYLQLGRLDEAVVEFERVLGINPNYARARLGLAQALERRGDRARARVEYELFLNIWRDADADAPLLVTAKRRLAALSGGRLKARTGDE